MKNVKIMMLVVAGGRIYGKRKMERGKWKKENGKRKMERGKWKEKNGKRKMERGKWKKENGKRKMEKREKRLKVRDLGQREFARTNKG